MTEIDILAVLVIWAQMLVNTGFVLQILARAHLAPLMYGLVYRRIAVRLVVKIGIMVGKFDILTYFGYISMNVTKYDGI